MEVNTGKQHQYSVGRPKVVGRGGGQHGRKQHLASLGIFGDRVEGCLYHHIAAIRDGFEAAAPTFPVFRLAGGCCI